MYVPVGPHLVLRTEGMRIRAIGEWQYACSSWSTPTVKNGRMRIRAIGEWQNVCSSWSTPGVENGRNENKSNLRFEVCLFQLVHT